MLFLSLSHLPEYPDCAELDIYIISINDIRVRALIDSGASVNFIDPKWLRKNLHNLQLKKISHDLKLILGDGTPSNFKIEELVALKQTFSNGATMDVNCLVWPLNNSFDIILGKHG